MNQLIALLAFMLAITPAFAENLESRVFRDQWDREIRLDKSVQWLLFSYSRKGGDWIAKSMKEAGITDPAGRKLLIVADISKMPGMITRMIALPKMRRLSYPMAISSDGTETANWPRKGEHLVLYRLENMQITKIQAFDSQQALQLALGRL